MMKNNIVDWIDGTPVHLGAMVDISYRKQYEEQLKRFAATDAMTDVYNRKWGYDKLLDQFAEPADARRNQTLCFLDIDGLKRVNDTFGHASGDEMIINTIQTVFSCIRKDDFIIRWGGDEFILFLNCGLANAEKVMDKVAFGFEHFNTTRNRPYRISVSSGLVDFSEPFPCLSELIHEADRRMYQDKMAKRNRTGIFLR
jgi:diguanylate cyclase (GGDEF)-like protein